MQKRVTLGPVIMMAFALVAGCNGQRGTATSTTTKRASDDAAKATTSARPVGPVSLDSPYRRKAHMYRGQLHAHTTNSDGSQSAADVVRAYKRAGYGFVAITDHNVNTPDPRVPGILFIPGVENDHTCLHENRINATTVAPGARLPQDVIDQANREGSFVIINHPDWPGVYPANPCWSDEALLAVRSYDAVEVWNASCEAKHNRYEHRIDFLLSNGRRTYLAAVDDCHGTHLPYCFTSSVNVFADALTLPEIMGNLKSGNFYASSGAHITSVSAAGGSVAVTVPAPSDIEFIANGGKTVKTERGATNAAYAASGDETYVRIRVTRLADRRMAWSNPIYVTAAPSSPAGG